MLQGGTLLLTGGIFLSKRRNSHATIIHALDLHNFPQEKILCTFFLKKKILSAANLLIIHLKQYKFVEHLSSPLTSPNFYD